MKTRIFTLFTILLVISAAFMAGAIGQYAAASGPAVVQSAYCQAAATSTTITAGATHASCGAGSQMYFHDFTTNLTAGDFLVVGAENTAALISASDTANHIHFISLINASNSGGAMTQRISIWYGLINHTEADTVTVLGNSGTMSEWIQEVSGLAGLTPLSTYGSNVKGTINCCSVASFNQGLYTFAIMTTDITQSGTWAFTPTFTGFYTVGGDVQYTTNAESNTNVMVNGTLPTSFDNDLSDWTEAAVSFYQACTTTTTSTSTNYTATVSLTTTVFSDLAVDYGNLWVIFLVVGTVFAIAVYFIIQLRKAATG